MSKGVSRSTAWGERMLSPHLKLPEKDSNLLRLLIQSCASPVSSMC
jgi:hypothetical protein